MGLVLPASTLAPASPTSTEILADLVRRCGRDEEIAGAFATIAAYCGFDGMTFLLLADATGASTVVSHWTSSCARWRARYAERQYQSADPRVLLTRGRSIPVIWQSSHAAAACGTPPFAADAARFGLRSGVAVSFDDAQVGRIVLAWDSSDPLIDAGRGGVLREQLGALVLLAGFVREAMLEHCRTALTSRPSARLTPRERQCIAFAARGLTSVDIGVKLGITERTVNFHFGNITTKLGVLNRAEAIVRALALREVTPG